MAVHAYDYMDKVGVSVSLYTMPGRSSQKPQRLYTKTTSVQGTGETDERQWIIDALVALLEEL